MAQQPVSLAKRIRIQAKRVAPARIVNVGNSSIPIQTGPWSEVESGSRPTAAQDAACDLFEYGLDGDGLIVPDENAAYGATCGLASTDVRWLYSPMQRTTMTYNDIKLAPNMAGLKGKRVAFAWFQGATESLQVVVTTTENWIPNGDPNSSTQRGDLNAVIIDFGVVDQIPNLTYLWADVDLGVNTLQLPQDGSGGCIMMFRTGNNTAFSTLNAPAFWGSKAGNPSNPQDPFEFQSKTTNNGVFSVPADKINMSFSVCPDPLCTMIVLLTDNPSVIAPTAQALGLGKFTGGNLASLAADDNNAETMCKFFVPTVSSPFIRLDLTATSPTLSPSALRARIKSKMVTAGVFQQTLYLNDFAANSFNLSRVDTTNTTNSTVELIGTGTLSRFVNQSDGSVKVRIEVRQTGPSTSITPCYSIEFLNWIIAP